MRKLLLAGVIAGAFAATAANAQQASGNLMGDGKTGDTVIVDSTDTGFHRELTLQEDGRYNIRRLPIGIYVVTVRHADGTTEPAQGIRVQAGTTARVK